MSLLIQFAVAILRMLLELFIDKHQPTSEDAAPDARRDRLNEQIREHWRDP